MSRHATAAPLTVTRDTQRLDVIYSCPNGSAFFTPDGEGRIWFDSTTEACDETGIDTIHILLTEPED